MKIWRHNHHSITTRTSILAKSGAASQNRSFHQRRNQILQVWPILQDLSKSRKSEDKNPMSKEEPIMNEDNPCQNKGSWSKSHKSLNARKIDQETCSMTRIHLNIWSWTTAKAWNKRMITRTQIVWFNHLLINKTRLMIWPKRTNNSTCTSLTRKICLTILVNCRNVRCMTPGMIRGSAALACRKLDPAKISSSRRARKTCCRTLQRTSRK